MGKKKLYKGIGLFLVGVMLITFFIGLAALPEMPDASIANPETNMEGNQ